MHTSCWHIFTQATPCLSLYFYVEGWIFHVHKASLTLSWCVLVSWSCCFCVLATVSCRLCRCDWASSRLCCSMASCAACCPARASLMDTSSFTCARRDAHNGFHWLGGTNSFFMQEGHWLRAMNSKNKLYVRDLDKSSVWGLVYCYVSLFMCSTYMKFYLYSFVNVSPSISA